MDFVRLGDSKVKLTLTAEDMKKYGVTEKDLSADTAARRRVLLNLLDEAKKRTGIDTSGAKTLVEAFPGRNSGCELFVTVLRAKGEVHTAVCYRFPDIGTARSAASKLVEEADATDTSALYALDGGEAVLALSIGERGARALSAYSFLDEYGKKEKSPFFYAYVKEYGTCLYECRALARLTREKNDFSV